MQLPSPALFISSLLLSGPTLVLAGPENSFCGGQGAIPNRDNCLAAANKINTGRDYSPNTEFAAGDCKVRWSASNVIKGSIFKAQALDIITDGCEGSGWCGDRGGNVSVSKCFVCMYGQCAVCNAPRTRDTESPLPVPLDLGSDETSTPTKPRREPAHLVTRQTPEAGVTCTSTLGPVPVTACKALANSLRGKTLQLPYVTSKDNCDLAIFAHFQRRTANGDTVADRISHDTDLCKSSGSRPVVGSQKDTTQEKYLFYGYTIWFGNLCGRFGFGIANCVP
ncbi:hypothetical protein V8F33_008233 [Rhypophila sp. PSN 637]